MIGVLKKFTDCTPHPLRRPIKDISRKKPIALVHTFSILTLRKGTNNLRSLGFHSQVIGNIDLSTK